MFVPVPNQACSGTDSNNAWYEDNSAASFNHMMVYDIVLNLLIWYLISWLFVYAKIETNMQTECEVIVVVWVWRSSRYEMMHILVPFISFVTSACSLSKLMIISSSFIIKEENQNTIMVFFQQHSIALWGVS